MPSIQVNQANFYYELHGHGPALVLISGFSGPGASWLPLIEELKDHFQILIFDNRGVGSTTDAGVALTIELMADDVIALCKALGLHQPHIVGRSMGGNIALTIAAKYPDLINKIGILVSSAKWRQAALTAMETQLKLQEQNIDKEILFDLSYAWLLGENFLTDTVFYNFLKAAQLNAVNLPSLNNLKRQWQALKNFDGRSLLPLVKAPTLVAYGIEDLLALPQEAKFIAQHIKQAKLVEFECGHMIAIEQKDKLIQELIAFLN